MSADVLLDDLHPLLVRAGGVELVFEAVHHVRLDIGDVDVELLVPPAQLVDRSVLLTQQRIVDSRLVLPDLDVLLEAHLDEIAETARVVGDANYFLVKNFINNTTFFEWDPAVYNSYFKKIKGAEEITIPKLNEMAYEQVEVASVPFVSFVGNKGAKGETSNYSFVLRGYVRHWLGNVWGEFDRVKLVDMVSPKIESNVRQVAG